MVEHSGTSGATGARNSRGPGLGVSWAASHAGGHRASLTLGNERRLLVGIGTEPAALSSRAGDSAWIGSVVTQGVAALTGHRHRLSVFKKLAMEGKKEQSRQRALACQAGADQATCGGLKTHGSCELCWAYTGRHLPHPSGGAGFFKLQDFGIQNLLDKGTVTQSPDQVNHQACLFPAPPSLILEKK